MVTSQTTEDTSSTTRTIAGIPGTASNLPETAARPAPGGAGTSRKTENVNYETSRTVKRTVLPQGTIKRLSVSVLVDQEAHWEGTGATAKHILEPPSPERLKTIHDLAAAATGLNADRGDQLIVESLPFESTLNLEPPAALESVAPAPIGQTSLLAQLKSKPKIAIGAAASLALILGAIFFVVRRFAMRSKNSQTLATPALPEASDRK